LREMFAVLACLLNSAAPPLNTLFFFGTVAHYCPGHPHLRPLLRMGGSSIPWPLCLRRRRKRAPFHRLA
jgi:hypothetical protein